MENHSNILFIMCDQLRADYLGCAGHPHLRTPVIDELASEGVRFEQTFCNAPVCGPSRASFYTGRYATCHGATYNNFPLRADEWTLGDYLSPLGVRSVLVGKTHMKPDRAAMQRLGIDPSSDIGLHLANSGFEPWEHDDGLHPMQNHDPDLPYNRYLRALGYHSQNPWNDFANSSERSDGTLLSGWYLRHAGHPARVREEHSETAYMTDRAMEFIQGAGTTPWCLHLSYIKPHWPYMAPSPYHEAYGPEQVIAANRSDRELVDAHPVVEAFRRHDESRAFSGEPCRRVVIPTYMGLIEQIDHHLGRLFGFLKENGLWNRTLIVFTSDHGDFLGDHWLGEKELFYEESLRIPLIIRDPSAQADHMRGTVRTELVESVDMIPTFIDFLGGVAQPTRLEGRSLLPLLRDSGIPDRWRETAFAECDYSLRSARTTLGLTPNQARGFVARTEQWKYVYFPGFPTQLFDLVHDPGELRDLGTCADYRRIRNEMRDMLLEWLALRRVRTTVTDEWIEEATGKARQRGYLFGVW